MKIHLLSDLHLEFVPGWKPDPQTVAAADVVVLAGDINQGVAGMDWAKKHLQGKPIVYVAGNHEFYNGNWTRTLQQLRDVAQTNGIHFLEDDSFTIGRMRFLGCSLWTDFAFFGTPDASMSEYEEGLLDCRAITVDVHSPEAPMKRRLTPQDVLDRHQRSRAWLEVEVQLQQQFDGRTVVVTHHVPSRRSIAARFINDRLTPGFAADLPDALITRADLWVHGHTHDSSHYRVFSQDEEEVREVHVACNPQGYPLATGGMENRKFDGKLLLQVPG